MLPSRDRQTLPAATSRYTSDTAATAEALSSETSSDSSEPGLTANTDASPDITAISAKTFRRRRTPGGHSFERDNRPGWRVGGLVARLRGLTSTLKRSDAHE